ncbi:MAG: DUF2141 domain-containing protein [Thiohalocapsa sp.]
MRCKVLMCAFACAMMFIAGSASAARLIVTIDGVRNAQGGVYVGLYATPSKFLNGNQCDAQRKVRASTGPVTVVFDNLPPGTYAVGAYHDENNNDHFDTNFLGLPMEGYALSNGIRAVVSKPTFQQAAFTVGNEDKPVALHIRY